MNLQAPFKRVEKKPKWLHSLQSNVEVDRTLFKDYYSLRRTLYELLGSFGDGINVQALLS